MVHADECELSPIGMSLLSIVDGIEVVATAVSEHHNELHEFAAASRKQDEKQCEFVHSIIITAVDG